MAPDVDVVGPFTGEVHRFVVDEFRLPRSSTEVKAMGGDLDGDGSSENRLEGSSPSSIRRPTGPTTRRRTAPR